MPEPASPNTVSCPHCGQDYSVTPEQRAQYRGQTINCTKCGRPFTVDGGPASPAGPPPVGGAAPPPTPVQQYASPYEAYQRPERTSKLAVASLVTGLLAFVIPVIAGVAAIIMGIVALTRTKDPRVGGKGLAIAGISLGAVGALVSTCLILPLILLPSLNRAREQANRIKCATNMRQIGLAVVMYANENKGQFPDTIEKVLATQDVASDVFVCPSTTHEPAPGGSSQAQAANLLNGPHLSYVYVGQGLDF